ncbi:hypothetical protein D3C71_1502620 [compost metagenome]
MDKRVSLTAAQLKKPKLSRMTAMTIVAIMVMDAPPIFWMMFATSWRDTIPVSRIIPAPTDAGQASLIPPGLQKITSIAIINTKPVITMSNVIVSPSFMTIDRAVLDFLALYLYSSENTRNWPFVHIFEYVLSTLAIPNFARERPVLSGLLKQFTKWIHF